jgi:quinol monooxygenase YgiN
MESTAPVVVVATFVPRHQAKEEVKAAVLRAVSSTHKRDEGCELYAAHEDAHDSDNIVVIEKWSSAEALRAHGSGEAFSALTAEVAELLAEPLGVAILHPLPAGENKLGTL